MKFKSIKDTEERIAVWGWMDDVVHATKGKTAVDFWENYGIPRKKGKAGGLFTTPFFGGETPVNHGAISCNSLWFKDAFGKCDWKKVCETFATAMGL